MSSGAAPVSFEEAKRMPKEEIDTYLELDNLYSKMQRQYEKKKKGSI
jgi:hypothetical protein